jgi:uncharacterized protein YcnI
MPSRMPQTRRSRSRTCAVTLSAAVACAALIVAAPASAHVVVMPSIVPVGSPSEFAIQVPTERNVPTTAVRVMFPLHVSVFSFQVAPPGFVVAPIHAKNQSLVGAVYRGVIPVGDYVTFRFLGTPSSTGNMLWPTYQTYADGLVKPWTGPPETPGGVEVENGPTQPGPTPAIAVVAAGTRSTTSTQGAGTPGAGPTSSGSSSEASIWLGVIAIVLALGAAAAAGLLWVTRPARLPDDGIDPPTL